MAQTTFPPPDIAHIGLERDRFKELLIEAFVEALSILKNKQFPTQDRSVVRPNKQGFDTKNLEGTAFNTAIWREADSLARMPGFSKLTEYAWSRGAFRQTITRDDEQVPERAAWERYLWGTLIHAPFERMLRHTELEDLVASGETRGVHIEADRIETVASGIASKVCDKQRIIEAFCPIHLPRGGEGCAFDIQSGISVVHWTVEQQCVFLTKYGDEYSFDDFPAHFANGLLKVDVKLETNLDSHAVIADALDRGKWGLSQAAECDFALGENPVVIREIDGTRVPTLRRSSRNLDLSSPVFDRPLADTVSGASDAVHQFQRAAQAVRGLERALWLFGRANNASLPRDSVLDAVIGLESLLVASPGETTYKFALHGTAVLTHYADDVHQELKSLYGLRSKAAHSGASEDSKFTENAPRARQLLAQALYRIAILINGNVLKFEKSDASVGKAVEKWVRDIVIEHPSVTQSAVQTEKCS